MQKGSEKNGYWLEFEALVAAGPADVLALGLPEQGGLEVPWFGDSKISKPKAIDPQATE